jgi:hypothetical protein
MEDKIEVGEWVRIDNGIIFKLLTKKKTSYGYCGETDNGKMPTYVYGKGKGLPYEIKDKIVKHSKNIIDLIEEGDILCFHWGVETNPDEKSFVIKCNNTLNVWDAGLYIPLTSIKILSIITREQIAQIEYKVEE